MGTGPCAPRGGAECKHWLGGPVSALADVAFLVLKPLQKVTGFLRFQFIRTSFDKIRFDQNKFAALDWDPVFVLIDFVYIFDLINEHVVLTSYFLLY